MIQLKQQGYIRRLIAGPHVFDDPGAHDGLLASPEIDCCIGPDAWCRLVLRFLPSIAPRCLPWVAGVDLEFWRPDAGRTRNRVLVYDKQISGPTAPVDPYREGLARRGHQLSLLAYGTYSAEQYRELLRMSKLMVYFARSETQGIALAEAWACGVPTLVWRNSEPTYLGVAYGGSTAPCLTDATGRFFSNMEEFGTLLAQWETDPSGFTPRQWCEEHMSDEICVRNLLAIVREI